MAGLRNLGRTLLRAGIAAAVLAGLTIAPVAAQDVRPQILTVDQDRLFVESAFGRASFDRERLAKTALEAENAKIETALVAEEQDLTNRRAALESDAFTALANAFDAKVESIRAAQDEKARELGRAREADRMTFRRAVVPVLGKLMQDKGAVAIIDGASVILSAPAIDVTDEAIVRIDAALAPGEIVAPPEPDPAPSPEPDVGPDVGSTEVQKPATAPVTP
ncbi:MAG: OmpH family outer membrane protein [Rhodobacterales bacterium]|nr:OmpH family outer membrane protein [Rhodobacterales bacterium]